MCESESAVKGISPCARVSQLSRCRLKFKLPSCPDPSPLSYFATISEKSSLVAMEGSGS